MKLCKSPQLWSAIPILLLLALPLHAQSLRRPSAAIQSGGADTNFETANDSDSSAFTFNPASEWTVENLRAASTPPLDPTTLAVERMCAHLNRRFPSFSAEPQSTSCAAQHVDPDNKADGPADSARTTSTLVAESRKRPDRNLDVYYRNRREFSLDVGWHPANIPFIYDFAVGSGYNMTPLKYTLVPIIASLRWHVTNVGWRWIFRGNMDFTFSGSITAIPRGPETHYYSFDFGIRRNFVYRNWKVVPSSSNAAARESLTRKNLWESFSLRARTSPLPTTWALAHAITSIPNILYPRA